MPQAIQHIVVLMLENRSFDHMLGFMRNTDYPIDGLTGNEWNPRDPAHIDPTQEVRVSNDAGFIFSYDPGHSFHDVNLQLFDNPTGPPATSYQMPDSSSAIHSNRTSRRQLPTQS
jgi:phospholipase C